MHPLELTPKPTIDSRIDVANFPFIKYLRKAIHNSGFFYADQCDYSDLDRCYFLGSCYIGQNYLRVNLFEPSHIPPLPALSKEFYLFTMAPGMTNVTETAEMVLNIWQWAPQLVASNLIPSYTADKNLVEAVYRNHNSTYEHILLPTSNENVFVIIIIDLGTAAAKGYYVLNLQEEYS